MKPSRSLLVVLGAALAGCVPSLPEDDPHVTAPRLLAVRLDPPESRPGDGVAVHALVGSGAGALGDAPVEWALCEAPKSPSENRIVSVNCLEDPGVLVDPGAETTFTVPADACALFGSETPPGDFRPRDPDSTGGYYLPLRANVDGARSIALSRLTCGLRSVPIDVASELAKRYTPNRNPTLAGLDATVDGRAVALDAIPSGHRVTLTARASRGDLERYAIVEPSNQAVTDAREDLVVTFYATVGALDAERVAAIEGKDGAPAASVTWTSDAPGASFLFVVVRDSRGGSDFATFPVVTLGDGS